MATKKLPQWAIDILELAIGFELSAADKRTINATIRTLLETCPNEDNNMLYDKAYKVCKPMIWRKLA